MVKTNKATKKFDFRYAVVCVLILIAVAIRITGKLDYHNSLILDLIRSGIYIGIISAWGISVRKRIIQVQARRYLTCIAVFMVIWLTVRSVKFHFVHSAVLNHQLWYWYYLAMLFIPLFALFVSVSLDKPDDYRLPKKLLFLYIIPTLILIMVLTNDIHQFVFVFPNGEIVADGPYEYGFGRYIVVGWQIICGTVAIATMISRCRIKANKAILSLPVVPLVTAMLYILIYSLNFKFFNFILGDMTVTLCLLITAVFESCIQRGLIQSNVGYDAMFSAMTISSQITDSDFNVILSSSTAKPTSKDSMAKAVFEPVSLDENTILKGHAIRKGYVFWNEDITELVNVSRELEKTHKELLDASDVIKEESEQKKRWLQIVEENCLYDIIEEQTLTQTTLLKSAVSKLKNTDNIDEAKKLLGEIVVIGTYIKRKSNLILVCGEKYIADARELWLCINETAKNLNLCGIDCNVNFNIDGALTPVLINIIYDFIEVVIETSLDSLKNILIFVGESDEIYTVNISIECDCDLSCLNERIPMLNFERDEDDIQYLSMNFDKGGEPVRNT